MCGVLGILGRLADGMSAAGFARLLDALAYRGPDGHGVHHEPGIWLGMRRLAVIDLQGGNQPFTSRGGDVVAFQNGEIYNHRDLQRELEALGYAFRSHCDTEVLAHGFDAWGIDGLLRRLDGMFAVAILERRSRRLHLARDRFGEKPLFFAMAPDGFAFASDLRVLRRLPAADAAIDPLALDRYLALHYVPRRRTMHRGIRRVLPGERLELDIEHWQATFENWYRADLSRPVEFRREELVGLLRRAVWSRLESEVPIGVFLSGGLDSSLVTAMAVESHPRIKTFSMGFSDPSRDESAAASAVARACGTEHHHFVFREQDFHVLMAEVVAALDEPLGDQAALPLYWLCREARQHVTVVLSGEGADEAFGGYDYYRGGGVLDLLGGRGDWRLLHGPRNTTPSGFPLLTSADERQRLVPGLRDEDDFWERAAMAQVATGATDQQRRSLADAMTWLPDDLLVKFDRMAMAHSLEGRAPYLMPALFEYGLRLPGAWRMDRRGSKLALREVARGLLPEEIVAGRKRGFVLPMRQWLIAWFGRAGPVARYVAERCTPGLDADFAARLIAEDLARGVERERLLFALVVLLEWSARNGCAAATARAIV